MIIFGFIAAFALMVMGFCIAVAAGAAGDMDDISPASPLTAFLVAAIFLVLQAVLWVSFGMHMGGV